MRIIVTGANGFIGREIVSELLKYDNFVFGIGRTKKLQLNSSFKAESYNFIISDITEKRSLKNLEKLENIDAIIHCAGLAHQFGEIEKEKFSRVNVSGTKNIVELAVKLKAAQFILISSTAVYGIKTDVIDEDTVCEPETFYAESKLEAEKVCNEICRQNNLPLTILRLAPVIGENNAGNVARLVRAIDKRRFIWIGNGKNIKTLIYKTDVARAVPKILQNKTKEIEVFNLAAEPVSMKEIVGEIEKNLGNNVPKFFLPSGILQRLLLINKKTFGIAKINKISDTIEKWLSDDVYSARKIKEKYYYVPETSMAEAINKQVKFYLEEKKKG